MKIEYKRLTENELDIFIEMRINQNYAGGLLLEAGGRCKEKNLDDVN